MVTDLASDVPQAHASRSPWLILAIASLAVFVVSLDGTVLFVAFPAIRKTYERVSPEALSWILNVYTIGYGALLVPAGRLADRYGRRFFFLTGAGTFTVASALCGAATTVGSLILARAAQSIGAALLMPASLALVLEAFPSKGRGPAIGIWGATGALAAAIGPALGSAVIQYANWRWVFFLNLPVGLLAIAAGVRRLSESRAREKGALPDLLGAAILMAAFGLLAYAIVGARQYPSAAPAGALLLASFVWRSLRHPVPALDLRLFRLRSFAVANVMTVVFGVAFTAMFFGNVLFLTERWHRSIFEAGLWMSPGPLAVMPVAVLAGRYTDRIGYRPIFIAGGLLYSAGAAYLLHTVDKAASFALWLPGAIVMGVAIGMILPSLSGASTRELDSATLGVGSAVHQAMRQFGSVLGVAVVVLILGAVTEAGPFRARLRLDAGRWSIHGPGRRRLPRAPPDCGRA